MNNTYKNFKQLSTLYYNQEADINYVVLDYQMTKDPVCLAFVFCKLYPYMVTVVNRYYYLTDEDKSSFCVEELSKTMKDYSYSKKTKVQTLFSKYLTNRLRSETENLSYDKRKADNVTDNYEYKVKTHVYVEEQYDHIEYLESLRENPSLSVNELMYCELVVSNGNKIKDTDIAKTLGISSAAITYIKESLTKKLNYTV